MFRLTWRNLVARKVRLVMSTLAIVLGIGFLAGVLTFSHGLGATFDNIIEGSTSDALVRTEGEVSFQASGAGTTKLVEPQVVDRLAELPEVAAADGSVDGVGAYLLGKDGKLVGGTGAPTLVFNYYDSVNAAGDPILILESGEWPDQPGEINLDASSAERGDYEVGDEVTLLLPTGELRQTFELVGTSNFNGGGTAGATLALLETSAAQDLFLDGEDAFTTVSLTAAEGVSQTELADAAKTVLPEGFTAVTGQEVIDESDEQIGQFLDVIGYFLIAFAVIAIVVGAFIIFNTFSILVSQRVRESALLRALGASRRQVTRSVLIEAFLMALLGSTLGLLVGLGLSRGLAAVFRSQGLDIAGDVLVLTPATVIAAYVVGISVTMVAAFVPARRAAKVPPVAALRDDLTVQEKALGRRRLVLGTIALLVGAALIGCRPDRRTRGRRGLDRRGRGDLGDHRRRHGTDPRAAGPAGLPGGVRQAVRHHRQARRRERAAQPASYGRHRVGADDRPRRGLGRRRAGLVAQRDQRRARRPRVPQRLPGPVPELPGLPHQGGRRDGRGRRRRHGVADAGLGGAGQEGPDLRDGRRRDVR